MSAAGVTGMVRARKVADTPYDEIATANIILAVLVPMRHAQLAAMSDRDRAFLAERTADVISCESDGLPGIRSKDMGNKGILGSLATGLALGADVPGGVTLWGVHYCADHDACQAAGL